MGRQKINPRHRTKSYDTIAVYIGDDMLYALDTSAALFDMSRSEYVRQAIEEKLFKGGDLELGKEGYNKVIAANAAEGTKKLRGKAVGHTDGSESAKGQKGGKKR